MYVSPVPQPVTADYVRTAIDRTQGRSMVMSSGGVAASEHPLASQAGASILARGGNAIDAALAVNAAMGVLAPMMNGVGGDLFAIVYEAASGKLHGINGSGYAPAALTIDSLRAGGITSMPQTGINAVTVPGAVAAWSMLTDRFGRLTLGDVLAPAIRIAEEGFPVPEITAAEWAGGQTLLRADAEAARVYLPDGRAPRVGQMFRNPDLAATYRALASGGRDAFYRGDIARRILRCSDRLSGPLTAADLAEYDAEWVAPLSTTYRGWTVYELPPNTQGIAALMMLNLMEPFPLGEYGFHSARALHVMIEAKKLAYADMLRYVADSRFSPAPVGAMLDKAQARRRGQGIGSARAARDVQPSTLDGLTTSAGQDTIYLSVIDREGTIVSLIQSIYEGFGAAIVPPGTGFALHNRGALFTLDQAHPNALAPRKRPLHTIIPGFMERGDTRIGFGIMGGFNQAQAHAQFVANIVDYGMDIQQALEAGRFTKSTFSGADVSIEALVPESVRAELAALGHEVTTVPPRTGTFGHGQAVMSDGSGVHFGASEPRHDGAAIPEVP
jgi:gamma-glutamyltranspeptidase / glutathione hydrolase